MKVTVPRQREPGQDGGWSAEGSERLTEATDCKQLWFTYSDKNSRLHLRWKICFLSFFYSKLYFSLNHQTWLLYAVHLFVENTHFASHIVTSVIFVGCSLFQLSRDICGIRCQKGHVSCRTSRHIQQSLRGIKYDSDRPHSKPVVSWFEWLPRFHFFHPSVLFRLSWSGSRGPEPIAAVWGREAGSSLDRAPVCHRGVTQTTIHAHIQTCGQFRVSNEPKATNWCLCGRKAEDPGRTHAAVPPCLRFHSQKLFQVFIESSLCFQLVGIHQCSKRIWCFLQRSTAKTNLKFGNQSSVRFTENQQRNKQNDKQDFYVFLQQWTYSDDLSVFVWKGCADSLEAVNLNLPRVSSSVSVSGQSADGNSSAARMVPFSCLRPCVSCLLYMTRCVDFETRTSDFGVHICLTVGKGVGFFGSFAN